MADRLVKCYGYCGQKYPKSTMIVFQNFNHCPECYEKKSREVSDRENLYNFIKKTYNLSFPTGNMLRQIKQYRQERNYTYKNIMFTLDYIYNIKKAYKPQPKFGIGLVPHFYDEMLEYYRNLKAKRESTEIMKPKVETIKVKPPIRSNDYRSKKLINMEELLK